MRLPGKSETPFCHRLRLPMNLLPVFVIVWSTVVATESPINRNALWQRLDKYFHPPTEFAGQLGPYRSPLRLADGTTVKTREEWPRRRAEILAMWHRRLGAWPPLLERPAVKRFETVERQGYTRHHVQVQTSPEGYVADGYLLIPPGKGPFPAVLVPFYEALTSIGEGKRGQGTHDYGLQLVRRGFVSCLSARLVPRRNSVWILPNC